MAITQESSAPLVVVVGSTGLQGGSVIKALSESVKVYRIRGLTRDPSKPASQALTKQGVEMFAVNLTVENKDAVFKAFEGATYAFVVTNFWEHYSKDREIAEGKMLVDAVKAANVKLLIWSGLEDFEKVSGGKYKHVYHFDGKAAVTSYALEVGVSLANVQAGPYMSNYLGMNAPRKQADGSYGIYAPVTPDSVAPLLDTANDYGLFVRQAIESPTGSGVDIFAHGEVTSYANIAKQLGEVTGKTVNFYQITPEQFMQGATGKGMPEAVARELLEMSQCIEEFGYYGPKDLSGSLKGLARAPRTWAEFVKANDWSKILN
ncbi:hypothetical protein FRB94_013683 [Tulasnella sp. JGI-2019a]|nr:hypothetical protein FRB93_011956 [Tulasnella sp. JGI-2019a]KAG9008126.1 hypothetical protein FRB94_013683 [Tulasnella sp. JGI-2019a]KAG9033523.1 hypothetical protein FRB95_014702 [Tulasnella sp. JGI-2019a]